MSPADYDAVAKIFADANENMKQGEIISRAELFEFISTNMSILFEKNNPRFDTKRFLKACKVI